MKGVVGIAEDYIESSFSQFNYTYIYNFFPIIQASNISLVSSFLSIKNFLRKKLE